MCAEHTGRPIYNVKGIKLLSMYIDAVPTFEQLVLPESSSLMIMSDGLK